MKSGWVKDEEKQTNASDREGAGEEKGGPREGGRKNEIVDETREMHSRVSKKLFMINTRNLLKLV